MQDLGYNDSNLYDDWRRMQTKAFLDRDVDHIINMFSTESAVSSAQDIQLRYMMMSRMTIDPYGNSSNKNKKPMNGGVMEEGGVIGGKPNSSEENPQEPLMNLKMSEYWLNMGEEGDQWINMFGFVLYTIHRTNARVSKYELKEIDGEKYVDEDAEEVPIEGPIACPHHYVKRARLFLKDHRLGVFVLNERLDAIDPDIHVYISKIPFWNNATFNSIGGRLLTAYRTLLNLRRIYEKVLIDNAFPVYAAHPIPVKGHEASTPMNYIDDPSLERIIVAEDNKIYKTTAELTQGIDPRTERVEEGTTNRLYTSFMQNGIIPNREDNLVVMPRGFNVDALPNSSYIGNIQLAQEQFTQDVCSQFQVPITFIRPSLANKNTLSLSEDALSALREFSLLHSSVLAKMLKTIWCTIYPDQLFEKLMINIPVSNNVALERIIQMIEHGMISHYHGAKKVVSSMHLQDDVDMDKMETLSKTLRPFKEKEQQKGGIPTKKRKASDSEDENKGKKAKVEEGEKKKKKKPSNKQVIEKLRKQLAKLKAEKKEQSTTTTTDSKTKEKPAKDKLKEKTTKDKKKKKKTT